MKIAYYNLVYSDIIKLYGLPESRIVYGSSYTGYLRWKLEGDFYLESLHKLELSMLTIDTLLESEIIHHNDIESRIQNIEDTYLINKYILPLFKNKTPLELLNFISTEYKNG